MQYPATDKEMIAILVAYDEFLSYWETIGQESSLDDEELPSNQIPDVLATLKEFLTRYGYLDVQT